MINYSWKLKTKHQAELLVFVGAEHQNQSSLEVVGYELESFSEVTMLLWSSVLFAMHTKSATTPSICNSVAMCSV